MTEDQVKAEAIRALDQSAEFSIMDNLITWNTSPIPDALITAKIIELQTAYDALAYARSRKAKYDLLNQDEMRYDDLTNSTTTWPDAIAAIKLEFPK